MYIQKAYDMDKTPYKKDWLVGTRIARGLIGVQRGVKIPTIQEYTDLFKCSRGIVQNAIDGLEETGAIVLDRRGKSGTWLAAKDEKKLFDNAGLHFITGSMPAPLSIHHAGLATGICQAMNKCAAPFTFAFVQGSKNRVEALLREVYDFVVVTQSAAEEYQACFPELALAFPLEGCVYSLPYTLYINKPGVSEVQDGMSIAADPTSTDQWELTELVCAGRDVRVLEMPYVSCNFAFLSGEADCVVMQGELSARQANLNSLFFAAERRMSLAEVSAIPIECEKTEKLHQPVILVNRKNYGMDGILKSYLSGNLVSHIQSLVIDFKMAPQFY